MVTTNAEIVKPRYLVLTRLWFYVMLKTPKQERVRYDIHILFHVGGNRLLSIIVYTTGLVGVRCSGVEYHYFVFFTNFTISVLFHHDI